jgi:hypothetical protein
MVGEIFASTQATMFSIVALGALEVGLLLACRREVRETTLMPAWWWAVIATVVLSGVEVLLSWSAGLAREGGSAVRFLAAGLTFCPMMAVLGARRPQHGAWQFIVISLWCILALPAVENLALQRGQALEIGGVRTAFVAGLIGMGALNWLPTRFWATAMLVGAGQMLLYLAYFPAFDSVAIPRRMELAAGCFLLGALTAVFVSRLPAAQTPLDRIWRDYRDWFGAMWGLRVRERVNAAAASYGWPVRLQWSGFRSAGGEPLPSVNALPPAMRDSFQVMLDNLLRRFVSSTWIANRLENHVH